MATSSSSGRRPEPTTATGVPRDDVHGLVECGVHPGCGEVRRLRDAALEAERDPLIRAQLALPDGSEVSKGEVWQRACHAFEIGDHRRDDYSEYWARKEVTCE